MAPVLFWFDHQENRKGILRPVGAIEHSEELNGQDSLRFSSWDLPDKYDRILWRDPQDGRWREHVVASASQGITGLCNVRADSSLADLKAAYVQEIHLNNDTNAEGAQKLLASTAWRVEQDAYERTIISTVYYHMSVYDALFDMVGKFGIDFEPVIYVEGEYVSARQIHFAYRLGKGRGLRFQAGRNLHLCRRAASSAELYTALYGWGAALPITDEDGNFTGGYTRRLSFEGYSGNESGLAWVGDDEAREKYGLWNLGRTVGEVNLPR